MYLDPYEQDRAEITGRTTVEGDDIRGRSRHVGDDEADTRIEFARMPFDLGDHPARYRPASGLIGEARIGSAHVIRWAANGAVEQISDPFLQGAVCRQTYGIFDPFGFEKLVDLGIGKSGVGLPR
jgi:hypothetical protein